MPCTGDKNDRIKDENNIENMDNTLTKNEDLNDETMNCSQIGTFNVGVDIGEIQVRWDRHHNFSDHIQSYIDSTNFFTIGQTFNSFLADEVDVP